MRLVSARRVYEDLLEIGRAEARIELASEDVARASTALVRLALHDPDRAWLEDLLAVHLASPDPRLRRVAATCTGHVARLHRALDTARLTPLLRGLTENPATAGAAEDALEDIAVFVVPT